MGLATPGAGNTILHSLTNNTTAAGAGPGSLSLTGVPPLIAAAMAKGIVEVGVNTDLQYGSNGVSNSVF